MPKFSSESTRGFYSTDIHGENIPSDAVEISDELYNELVLNKPAGKVIDWSGDTPVLTDPAPPSGAELASSARSKRDSLLRDVYDPGAHMLLRLQRTAPAEQQVAIAAKLAALDAYAQALQEIPEQPGFPHSINWPAPPSKEL